jgi:hypothetical protein
MKASLESTHPVFHKDEPEFVFDCAGRIMESQQVGECVSIALGFLQNTILVQSRFRCKARECLPATGGLRDEAYTEVRRNDEGNAAEGRFSAAC